MKSVFIGFSRSKNGMIGSELIQKYMHTNFSHTYFKFKESLFQDCTIYHATGHGLNYIAETTFLKHNTVAMEFELQISDELYNELMCDCHFNAGVKYGYYQNIGILFVDFLNKIGFSIKKNPIDDGINCSEWVYYLLEEVFGKWVDKDPNLVTPKDAYVFLKNRINIL